MLFDITVSRRSSHRIVESTTDFVKIQFSNVAAAFWSEHCIECGAPACYATCDKFEHSACGWCKRFENGIEPVRLENGSTAYAVKFRAWGKLELDTDGRALTIRMAHIVRWLDARLSPVVSFLTRLCFGLAPKRLSTFTSAYRRRRDVIARKLARPCSYDTWVIDCYSQNEESLTAAVSYLNEGEVMVHSLNLIHGWNHFEFDVHGLKPGAYFRIYSIEGTEGEVIFANLTVGVQDKVVRAGIPTTSKARAKYVKCVAWDLDNTMWEGVLANDGPSGLTLNENVMEVVKTLDARGIMNTIASKNDYNLAWQQLKNFGIADYFVFPRIDWMPKSQNLKLIAADMNIGIDAFAFVDDSFHERGEVGENLPMVRVYSEKDVEHLLEQECFNPPVSAESSKRRFSYLTEMSRKKSAAVFTGSHDDFLRSCEIRLVCESVKDDKVKKRCWELVNRTNQLTLAAHRYTEEEFDTLVRGSECFAIRCQDKYGDYGIVGFVAVGRESDTASVREFVMSCRVAKKKCEQSVVFAIADRKKVDGVKCLEAIVKETGRNRALIEAFDVMPFAVSKNGAERLYRLEFSAVDFADVALFRNPVEWKD